jgi:hypothetical protein
MAQGRAPLRGRAQRSGKDEAMSRSPGRKVVQIAATQPEELLVAICDVLSREADAMESWKNVSAARLRALAENILPIAPVFRRADGSLWMPVHPVSMDDLGDGRGRVACQDLLPPDHPFIAMFREHEAALEAEMARR